MAGVGTVRLLAALAIIYVLALAVRWGLTLLATLVVMVLGLIA